MKHIIIGFFLFLIMVFQPKVEAYDYKDCEIFVLPYMSHSHYLECLKNPNNYSHYFVYYTVTFNSDSTVLRTQSLRRGSSASAPPTPTKVGHTFAGWDRGFSNVQSNLTVRATWIKSQQVTFIDYNGTLLKTDFVEVGQDASPPPVTPRTGYQFAGWNGSYTNVTEDRTVQATYTPLLFTVTYMDSAGNVLQTDQVQYNNDSVPPSAPLIEGKTFVQWNASTTRITNNMTVYPEYATAIYQIRFFDEDTLVKTTNVEHGNNAVAPVMTKEGHQFMGWSTPVSNVKSSMDVNAIWNRNKYDVYFYDEEGVLLSHQQVEYKLPATAPVFTPPEGQQLQQWDDSFDEITNEMHLHPILETLKLQVYYMEDETLLHQETVDYGMSCVGFTPTKMGHDFISWSASCETIKTDKTLLALFEPHQFNVRFMDFEGQVIKEEIVSYKDSATAPDSEFPNYRFDGWNIGFDEVTSDLVVRPLGEIRTYRAVFKNYEGSTLCEFNVKYAEPVSCTPPNRVGYEFTGWSESLSITKDVTLIPNYSPLVFHVDFYVDDVLLKREQVRYNYSAVPPIVNLEGYDVKGWSQDVKNITSDMRVEALLEKKTYVVVFKVDQTTIKEQIVPHGVDAVPPSVVVKPGHTFTGWKDDYTNITTHRAIEADFDINTYVVTFFVEGNVVDQQRIEYQQDATAPQVDVEGHDVIGWRGEVTSITQDLDIHAILRAKRYTVTFVDEGIILKEEQVLYGQDATPPDEGPWDQGYTRITKDLFIQRRIILPETITEDIEIEEPVLSVNRPTIMATTSTRNGRIRYNFEVDLLMYEIQGLSIDPSDITFESTSFFNKEVNWLELEMDQPVLFQLQELSSNVVYDIVVEDAETSPIFITQLWQQLLSFITGIFA